MHLTILGASPATQNPGGACSSYLVRQGETTLVLDMGSGAFANLQRHVAPGAAARRPRLLLPPGGHETLLRISGMQDDSPTFFSGLFDVSEYDPTQPATVGALTITFHAMRHAPHTYGLRVEGAGTLAYSADSGP